MVMIALGEPLPEPFQRVHVETLSQKNRKLRCALAGRAHHFKRGAGTAAPSVQMPANANKTNSSYRSLDNHRETTHSSNPATDGQLSFAPYA
jgi:hypothetical protein